MAETEKKNILTDALNALSSKDEKAELEAANRKIAELEAKLTTTQKALATAQAASAKPAPTSSGVNVQAAVAQANQRADNAERRVRELEAQLKSAGLTPTTGSYAQGLVSAAPKFIAEHELKADETLSHLALQYYGHATPKYWKYIYEYNKDVVGPKPNKVRPGMLIKIPELPPGFEAKK